MTNRSVLETRWTEMKGRITEAWGAITDDDLDRLNGRWDQLVATVRDKTGEAVDSIESKLDEMMGSRSELDTRWDQMKGRITEAWGAITDDDTKRLQGRWDQLVAIIRDKTDATVEDIESKLDEMIDSLDRESATSSS